MNLMRTMVAKVAHQIPDRRPLQLVDGERVDVGDRDSEWPEFVFATASHGTGWVPARHLSATSGTAVVQIAYDTTELPTQGRRGGLAAGGDLQRGRRQLVAVGRERQGSDARQRAGVSRAVGTA